MLIAYGMSIVGTSHVGKNTPCQDSHCYELLANGWMAVAVADGVGSAKHSEVASKMACDTFIETCKTCITQETQISELKDIIKKAYAAADQQIKDHVYKIDDIITDYDTTLSTVIYDGKHIIYGHSGDGGIVVLTTSGDYIKVTQPQKADDGICVVPLRAGEAHWEFGECEADVASVLLATDGVYDNFMPYLLRGQPVELYVPLIRWFMDNNAIGITDENREQVEESRKRFLCGDSCKAITDDKTIVVAFNADIIPSLKDDSYYAEPDWAKLQDIWNRKAYPHLYKNSKPEEKNMCTDSPNDSTEATEDVAAEEITDDSANDNAKENDLQDSVENTTVVNESIDKTEVIVDSNAENVTKTKKKLFGLLGKRGKSK